MSYEAEIPPHQLDLVDAAFGPIAPEVAQACHQALPAEVIPLPDLEAYYRITPGMDTSKPTAGYKRGWFLIEKGLSTKDLGCFAEADAQFAALQESGTSILDRYEIAALRASLPAFEDRVCYGVVLPSTAQRIYSNLINVLRTTSGSSDNEANGMNAQISVGAMGAYRAYTRREGRYFLFPSSPREGKGQRYDYNENHDFYMLEGDPPRKLRIESKIHSLASSARRRRQKGSRPKRTYNPEILRINFSQLIVNVLHQEPAIHPERQDLRVGAGRPAQNATARLQFFMELCINGETGLIDATTRSLASRIGEHRRKIIIPGRKNAEQSTAEPEQNEAPSAISSLGSLASSLNTILDLLETGGLSETVIAEVEDRIQTLIANTMGHSELADPLSPAKIKLAQALGALDRARSQISGYSERTGLTDKQ